MVTSLVLLAAHIPESAKVNTQDHPLCADFASFMKDAKAFTTTAHSLRERLEAIVWLLRGDPLGTYLRAKVRSSQLELRRLAVVNYSQAFPDRMRRESMAGSQGVGPL
jgi:hypothetical protein